MIEPTDVCYRRAITSRTSFFLEVFLLYQQGHLFVAGGISDQPTIFLQAMTFIAGYLKRGD